MSIERTLSIIKPDAVAKNIIGEIYTRFEKAQLRIIAAKPTSQQHQTDSLRVASKLAITLAPISTATMASEAATGT